MYIKAIIMCKSINNCKELIGNKCEKMPLCVFHILFIMEGKFEKIAYMYANFFLKTRLNILLVFLLYLSINIFPILI